MHGIAEPLYLIMPFLERLAPRRSLHKRIDTFADDLQQILREQKASAGINMLTNMLRDVQLTDRELRDNMLLLFISGHVRCILHVSSICSAH